MKRMIFFTLCFVLLIAQSAIASEVLKLATTTSTYESGILDHVLIPFETEYNVKVHIISVGTGKAIKLGENGDVDLILVHARSAEDAFISQGYGVKRRDVMYNDFVILGPQDDPAHIEGLNDAKVAFQKIRDGKYLFVSRGDDSGTNMKEKALWAKAKIDPRGDWYLETGQGMSATLRVADEKNAYCLLDRATYLFNKDAIRLKNLVEGDEDLFNPYGVIAVNPQKHLHVNYKLSLSLIEWLVSVKCQKMIREYRVGGRQLFHANAKE